MKPVITELEGFGFPQWHGLASLLLADAHRRIGRLSDVAALTRTGIEIATRAQYWYAVATGERIAGRTARVEGRLEDATAAFGRARRTFEGIGARFEAERTRMEADFRAIAESELRSPEDRKH